MLGAVLCRSGLLQLALLTAAAVPDAPRNPTRVFGGFKWCDCGTGRDYITVIPDGRVALAANITPFQPSPWLPWRARSIRWVCSGSAATFDQKGSGAEAWWAAALPIPLSNGEPTKK
eukprot:SAG11_NODE_16334_length_550_cov_1.119734_1_plen_116_part_10